MTDITKPGIYDLPEDEYHGDPTEEGSLSYSGAKVILDSPARYLWERENRPTKREYDFGHAAHAKVLGKGLDVAEIPAKLLGSNGSVSTKEAKAFVQAARAEGKVPLKPDEVAVIDAMAARLAEHDVASALLRDGTPEQSMFWRDEETKVMLRARTDWLTTLGSGRPCIVDYKTTARTANPDRFGWEARDFNYHMQDSWYREGLDLLTDERHGFVFVVQEKKPPYFVSVVELDDEAREVGAQRNAVARRTYLWCRTREQWPAYPGIARITVPNAPYATDTLIEGEAS